MEQVATVRVPLTVEQRAEKAREMANLIAQIEGIESEAKYIATGFREDIKELETELRMIAAGVREGVDERAQMDLTFSQAEAARALSGVGAAVCICQSEDIRDPVCPLHGVETRGANPRDDGMGEAS